MKNIHDRRVIEKGTEIIRQDDIATAAYIIQKGKVEIYRTVEGEEKILATLGDGEIVGEMALIEKRKHYASVRAIEETVVYIVPPEVLDTKILRANPLIRMLVRALVARLDAANEELSKRL